MASLRVLVFDHEGRSVQFDTWLDDLQLYLLSDSKDSVSLFDLASGAATAPPATADSATRSQTAHALYDAVDARHSSPATAALGRLLLPYLFPELSAFATLEDLVSHLCTSDARYRDTVPAEFLNRNQTLMFIALYFIVTRLPESLRSVRDHFLSLDSTSITVDLLEQHLLAAETSALAVGAARGTPRLPFFEGCYPSPLAPSYASAAAADVSVAEDVGAASASAKRRSSKGKGGRGGGGGSGGGGGGSGSGGGGSSGGGGDGGTGGGSGGSGGGGGGSSGSGGSGGGGTGGGRTGPRRGGPGGGQRQQQQRRSETQSLQQLHEWLFQRGMSGGSDSCPYVIRSGIVAAALGASEFGILPGTAPHEALHTFTLDLGASRCFFRDSTTLTPLLAPVPVRLADPSGGPVVARSSTVLPYPAVPSDSLSGLHLPWSSQYTLATEPPQVAASAQVSASSPVSASPPALAYPALPSLHRGAAARRSSLLLVPLVDGSPADSPHGRTGAGGAGAIGAGAVDPGARGAGGTVRLRPYFVPLLQQVLGFPSSTSLTPPLLCPPPDQSQPPLLSASPLPAPSPYTEQSGGLTESREPARLVLSRLFALLVAFLVRVLLSRARTLWHSVPLPAPPDSSLREVPDPESDRARAASPIVSHLLATAVTEPSFESAVASALIAELLDFAAAYRLEYATALVADSTSASPPSIGGECALGTDVLEDKQEDCECLAATVPRFASMLLAPEGDSDAPDIPTQRSYAEAITGPYSSQWQAAMDAEMASWKSTGTYGVDYFQTFSPTPKMTTLWVLLHVATQCDYKLHSLDFSTAFLQGSLHEEIWLRCPPGFTGSFPAQWSLCRPVYGLRQAPRKWHDTLRTTLAALVFAPSTADPSLFLRTDTSLLPFYVLVYVDDLVFATANTEALTLVKSELQKRHTCTDLGPSALQLPALLATAHSSVYRPIALNSTFGRFRRAEWSVPRACGLPHVPDDVHTT
ncbi:unnamed protein product [Closterium sp. NIES-53]